MIIFIKNEILIISLNLCCRINNILYGTPADSQEAVCLLKKKTDIQTLCLLITSFKRYITYFYWKIIEIINFSSIIYREIQTLKESNKDLEIKFSHCATKYNDLKRHLCDVKSKESMNARVIEYVIC